MTKSINSSITIRLSILLFFIVFPYYIFGQEKPSFVAFRSGASIPFGKYHEASLDKGSFTTTGFNVSVEGAWFFHPKLGVGGSAGLNYHPVDVSILGWELVLEDPFLQDVTIRSDPYQMITAMAGAYTQIPIIGKFHFTGKILGGLLYGKTPYQLYKPEYFITGPPYYEITSSKDWKFSWQAGVGLRYDISPCFGLVIDSEIFYDKLIFGFRTANGIRYDEHIISFINTTLGIRFDL